MKLISLLSIVALNSAAVTASGCNVEGNLFYLQAFAPSTTADIISVSQWGNEGTDTIARLDDSNVPEERQAYFYINKDNNRLIVLDPFNFPSASNAYTDRPDGGELRFTFYNDTDRTFYWPSFDINSAGNLTVNGSSTAFSRCASTNNSSSSSSSSTSFQGSIVIGSTAGRNCEPLNLGVAPITSQLSVE